MKLEDAEIVEKYAFTLLQQGVSPSQSAHRALVHAGYRQPEDKVPTAPEPSEADRRRDADVIADLVNEAVAGGYAGDVERLRRWLRNRLDIIRRVSAGIAEHHHDLLEAIAGAGGLDPFQLLVHLLAPRERHRTLDSQTKTDFDPLLETLLRHFQSNRTQEGDQKVKHILSDARDIARQTAHMTSDETTSQLALLDRVEQMLFPA